jgi:iron complex transport system ATP-binding protein
MIECKNLNIKRLNKTLLRDFNQKFLEGQVWAILGKNGVGKTTLLDTLAGFHSYDSGNILLNNQELSKITILNRAQNISYLSQLHEASLDGSIIQSVSFGRYAWQQKSFDKTKEKAIIDKVMLQMELTDIQNNNILQLSGGERRKVELATMLVQDGDVLLLDEPLNHLDLNFRVKLMKLLKNISKTKLIIMVTHDLQFVQKYCSHILIMAHQDSWVSGTVESTLTKNNLSLMLDINLDEIVL